MHSDLSFWLLTLMQTKLELCVCLQLYACPYKMPNTEKEA